ELVIDGEHISDRVWTYVAARARRERGDWMTVAVGFAMRGLRATVPYSARRGTQELVHSDLVYRLVTALAGHEDDADIEAPQPAQAGTEPAPLTEAISEPTGPQDSQGQDGQAPVSAP